MAAIQRVTKSTLLVLEAIHQAGEPTWGVRIMQSSGLLSGTVYQILERLEQGGLLVAEWETDTERKGARRKLYQLTDLGRDSLEQVRAIVAGAEAAKALALAQTGHA